MPKFKIFIECGDHIINGESEGCSFDGCWDTNTLEFKYEGSRQDAEKEAERLSKEYPKPTFGWRLEEYK